MTFTGTGSQLGAYVQRKLERTAAELARNQRSSVEEGSFAAKDELLAEQRRATGGDGVLSGVGRSGARLGIRYDVKGRNNPTSLVKATGPAHLVEHPIGAHIITARGSGSRRNLNAAARVVGGRASLAAALGNASGLGAGGRRKPLRIPGVGYRAYARHPGVAGGRQPKPFKTGLPAARREAVRAMSKVHAEAFRRAIR